MGFLTSAFKQLGSDVAGGLDLLSAIFQKPLETTSAIVTGKGEKVLEIVKETKERPLKEQITSTAITTALSTAVLLSPIKAIIPKTAIGKAAVIVGSGAVATSPTIARVIEPTENIKRLFTAGQTTGKIIEGETAPKGLIDSLKAGGLVGAGAILGAGAIVGGGKVVESAKKKIPEFVVPAGEQLIMEKPAGIESVPITPETTTITTGVRKSKKRKKKVIPSMKQSIKINIVNKNLNKRYLKGDLLLI